MAEEKQKKQEIKPVEVKTVTVTKQIEVPPGYSLVVPVDKDGKEREDEAFVISNKMAERRFANHPQFTIKKKN